MWELIFKMGKVTIKELLKRYPHLWEEKFFIVDLILTQEKEGGIGPETEKKCIQLFRRGTKEEIKEIPYEPYM